MIGGSHLLQGGLVEPARDPQATDANAFENEHAVGNDYRFAPHRPIGDVDAVLTEQLHHPQSAVATHRIEGKSCSATSHDFFGCAAALVIIDEHGIRTQLLERGKLAFTAHEGNRPHTHVASNLDHATTDRRITQVLGNPVTFPELGKSMQQAPSGGRVHLEHGRLQAIDLGWQPEQPTCRHRGVRRPSIGSLEKHHPVPLLKIIGPTSLNHTASLDAGHSGELQPDPVGAFNGVEVGRVDGCRRDSHAHLAFSGSRRSKGLHFKRICRYSGIAKDQTQGLAHELRV